MGVSCLPQLNWAGIWSEFSSVSWHPALRWSQQESCNLCLPWWSTSWKFDSPTPGLYFQAAISMLVIRYIICQNKLCKWNEVNSTLVSATHFLKVEINLMIEITLKTKPKPRSTLLLSPFQRPFPYLLFFCYCNLSQKPDINWCHYVTPDLKWKY